MRDVKYFCDKCKRRVITLHPIERSAGSFTNDAGDLIGEVCGRCLRKLKKWIKEK